MKYFVFLMVSWWCTLYIHCCKMPVKVPKAMGIPQHAWDVLRRKQNRQFRINGGCRRWITDMQGVCSIRRSYPTNLTGTCILFDIPTCVVTKMSRGRERITVKRNHTECFRRLRGQRVIHPQLRNIQNDAEAENVATLSNNRQSREEISCEFPGVKEVIHPGVCVSGNKTETYGCMSLPTTAYPTAILQFRHRYCDLFDDAMYDDFYA